MYDFKVVIFGFSKYIFVSRTLQVMYDILKGKGFNTFMSFKRAFYSVFDIFTAIIISSANEVTKLHFIILNILNITSLLSQKIVFRAIEQIY